MIIFSTLFWASMICSFLFIVNSRMTSVLKEEDQDWKVTGTLFLVSAGLWTLTLLSFIIIAAITGGIDV